MNQKIRSFGVIAIVILWALLKIKTDEKTQRNLLEPYCFKGRRLQIGKR